MSSSRNDVRGLATLAVGVVDRVTAGRRRAPGGGRPGVRCPGAGRRRGACVHDSVTGGVHGSIRSSTASSSGPPTSDAGWCGPIVSCASSTGRRAGSRRSPRSTPRSATSCTRPGATWPSPCSCSTEASRGPRARWTSRGRWWCSSMDWVARSGAGGPAATAPRTSTCSRAASTPPPSRCGTTPDGTCRTTAGSCAATSSGWCSVGRFRWNRSTSWGTRWVGS